MEERIQISTGTVIMRSLVFDDEFEALKLTAEHMLKTTGKPSFDPYTKQKALMLLSIKTAPFEKTMEALGQVPRDDGLKLTDAYDRLNTTTMGESKPSAEPSSEGDSTTP